ncbi:glycosyltransferase family 4 protein [Ramlibacter solisilvae]|uniref:Glycosyl transferase n=1 Tax=Ramlibacter tataouinensis TaxID=94132 RepID=A0A127JUB2_9BURK|nr:glycosyltransferase family 4 protein [Ramlibacter tataouinensis]AMO23473.1 glycosyl transferase [Ramlibacter tataouinensis]
MRIAQVAPMFESVPPSGYGGTERVVSYLTETLVDLGHEVTLFASGDSVTSAKLVAVCQRSLRGRTDNTDWTAWHTLMLDEVFARADRFDVIHFHVDYLHYPMARHCATPCLTTLHGRLDLNHLPPLHRHFSDLPLVAISNHQRRQLPDAHFVATVHHGLPAELYGFTSEPLGYFAFVGRISPEKRLDRAIEIALACDTPLLVAAKVDAADRGYFEREIRPLLGHPLVKFVGEVDDAGKNSLLGSAKALLFPIDWPEPFGLVLIEAMACGTPVIAYPHGSVPELLEHGVTGFIVSNQRTAIDAARHIDRIDRRRCRQIFDERFTAKVMARRYLAVYRTLIDSHRRMDFASAGAK